MERALPVEWKRKLEVEVDKKNNERLLSVKGLPDLTEMGISIFIEQETGRMPL